MSAYGFSQADYKVSGEVKDTNQKGIAFVNVLLVKAQDSSLVKGTISNDDGTFTIKGIPIGSYRIVSSFVGYQTKYSEPFLLNQNFKINTITLREGEQLDEVVVEAKKPLYQQKTDRMVINVENSIVSSGSTALEVLERSPGVIINRQSNNISISGKDGVVLMINGKMSYMPASAVVQMLQGMSSDNIESIELITSPPANFDAEGNAGYINIVLKKRTDLGLNGSFTLSGGYGNGTITNNNLNFNYRKDKINIFGSYGFTLDERKNTFETSREYMENGNSLGTFTETNRDPRDRTHTIRLGMDVNTSENTIMGVLINAFDNKWTMDSYNYRYDTENGTPTSYLDIFNFELHTKKHIGLNYNLKHNFNKDSYLSFNADYLYFKFNNPTSYENTYYDNNRNFLQTEYLRAGKITPLDTWVGKLDYSNKLSDKLKIETGVKLTKSKFENYVNVDNLENGVWVEDPSLTNDSFLDENIYAIYGSADYSINDKTSIKSGLRFEQTRTVLETDRDGKVVDRDYGIFFPSVYLNHKINDTLSLNLSYTKRITRPTFNDLAPFVLFLDPNTFISGNASLQPAISNAYKFSVNYKSYFISFEYTNQDSTIAQFQEKLDPSTGRLIFEAANLDYTKTFGIVLGLPLKFTNWWRSQNNLNLVKQSVRTFYNGTPIKLSIGNFSANSSHSFKISENFSAELSGFYNGPGYFGSARYNGFYAINTGIQQKLKGNWGNIKFAINDLLDSLEFTGGTNLPDQNIKTSNVFDFSNRTFLITYSRNFGNSQVKAARERETGSEEERRRVN